ncbi:hypothetical protein ACFLVR_01355 [Chloroflexota bacterium]
MRMHVDRRSHELYDCRIDLLTGAGEEKYPVCRNKNVVLTSTLVLQYHLICHNCGYQGPQLSTKELRELL